VNKHSVCYEKLVIRHGIRCYDGAFDSKTQSVFDEQERVMKIIRTKYPEARVTYFPMEGKYLFATNVMDVSREFRPTYGDAVYDAYVELFPEEVP
jgi:hypothetical protein